MKLTGNQILSSEEVLNKLLNVEMSGMLAVALISNARAIAETSKPIREALQKTAQKYASKDENGEFLNKDNHYVFTGKDKYDCDKAFDEIVSAEYEVKDMIKIDINDFAKLGSIKPIELLSIDFMTK